MPELVGRCVVAGAGRADLPGVGVREIGRPRNVGELLEAVGDADTVVIHVDALRGPALGVRAPNARGRAWFAPEGWQVERAGDGSWLWLVRPSSGGRWRRVVVPAWDDRPNNPTGPWRGCGYDVLVGGLAFFSAAVGVSWAGSIGATAERLLESTHPRAKGGVQLHHAPEVPGPAMDGSLEQPFTWRRELGPGERAHGAFLHHFDFNSAYLSAWQTVELPAGGDPIHELAATFDVRRPGLWRVSGPELEAWWAKRAPGHPLPPWAGELGVKRWFTTPTLARCHELGWRGAVFEAWVWPARSRYLRAAAERLRDARVDLMGRADPGAVVALDAVKALYRVQTGRFNMGGRDERSRWRRPEFGHFVRAQARANLHRRLVGYPTRAGWVDGVELLPIAVTTDDLVFVAPEVLEAPAAYARAVGLPYGAGLGEVKSKGVARLTSTLLEQIDGAGNGSALMALVRGHESNG